MSNNFSWSPIAKEYDPIKCGSIDGTDTYPHDKALIRALNSNFKPPSAIRSKPSHVLFVARINHNTKEKKLKEVFEMFGDIKSIRLVRDIITGFSKGYAFIEYADKRSVDKAINDRNGIYIDNCKLLLDYEVGRTMKGWVPRRLGGGFGGKKESGQLRFGCRDRPFKRPLTQNEQDTKKFKRDISHRQ